jgi:hypothetical protein
MEGCCAEPTIFSTSQTTGTAVTFDYHAGWVDSLQIPSRTGPGGANLAGNGTIRYWRCVAHPGVLTLALLWVTWLVFDFLLGVLYRLGSPWVAALASAVRPLSGSASEVLLHPASRFALAVIFTLAVLYLVGLAATRVLGKRLIALGLSRLVLRWALRRTVRQPGRIGAKCRNPMFLGIHHRESRRNSGR